MLAFTMTKQIHTTVKYIHFVVHFTVEKANAFYNCDAGLKANRHPLEGLFEISVHSHFV
jgi:hypothetical protein